MHTRQCSRVEYSVYYTYGMDTTGTQTYAKKILVVIAVPVLCVGAYLIFSALRGSREPVACTMEARICPDGSAVGRVGPSCEFAPCPDAPSVAPGTAMLSVDETQQVGGISITFHGVKADYRCPSDVQCIQAGAIVADVTFADGTHTKRFNMPSDEAPLTFGVHRASITDIQPPLISTREADPNAYRVTFTVVPMTDSELVEVYLRDHIHDLSPEHEVLGGTFYVTKITFTGEDEAVVEYEDGHIALTADVMYTVSDARDVTITNFTVRKAPSSGASLDLSGRNLTRVPDDVFKKTDLTSLDVSSNNITGAVQGEIRHLADLERLDLSHNQFTGVPAEIGQLAKLRTLDLSYNKLTGLPYELGNLKHLEVLNLTGNAYSEQDLSVIRAQLPSTTNIITR